MNASCKDLMGTHEFSAFCKGQPSTDHYRCNVSQAHWSPIENGLEFHISANRFLRNMVRAIVGTQLDIGTGKMSLEEHRKLIAEGRRSDAGKSVPAHGLTLSAVDY
jgi:tRNA pseudouridine38-40 synthase